MYTKFTSLLYRICPEVWNGSAFTKLASNKDSTTGRRMEMARRNPNGPLNRGVHVMTYCSHGSCLESAVFTLPLQWISSNVNTHPWVKKGGIPRTYGQVLKPSFDLHPRETSTPFWRDLIDDSILRLSRDRVRARGRLYLITVTAVRPTLPGDNHALLEHTRLLSNDHEFRWYIICMLYYSPSRGCK